MNTFILFLPEREWMENVWRERRCAEDLNTTVQTKEKRNTKEINAFNIIITSQRSDYIYCSKKKKKRNKTTQWNKGGQTSLTKMFLSLVPDPARWKTYKSPLWPWMKDRGSRLPERMAFCRPRSVHTGHAVQPGRQTEVNMIPCHAAAQPDVKLNEWMQDALNA